MRNKTLIGLTAILIIAAFFRLYNLKYVPPGLYPDEAMNGSNALEAVATGKMKVFYPENNGREGLFINIQAILLKTIGKNEPWVLRLAAAIFGILSVAGSFFFARELFRRRFKNKKLFGMAKADIIALSASFLMAVSFWHILFSRIGFRANMAPAFLAWSLFFLYKAWSVREENILKTLSLGAIGGLLFGLGFHSYIAYRAAPLIAAVIFGFFLFDAIREKIIPRLGALFAVFSTAAATTIFPLASYFLSNPQDFMGRTAQVSIFASDTPLKDLILNILKTLGMFNFAGDGNWRHNYSGFPELAPIPGILFLIGIVLAIKVSLGFFGRNNRSSSEWAVVSVSWFAVSLLPVVVSNEGIPHALRAIMAIPAVFIFAAWGGLWIMERVKERLKGEKTKTVPLALFFLAAFMILESFFLYFILWGGDSRVQGSFGSDYVEIGKAINSLPEEQNKYVVVLAGGTDVRGIPMPAQTVMFLTDSFLEKGREEKNIRYLRSFDELPENRAGAAVFVIE